MSKINNQRRSLLKGAALTGAAASMPLSAGAAVTPIFDKLQRDEFPLPDFASAVEDLVSIQTEDGSVLNATIESVQDMAFECAQHSRPNYLRHCAKVVRFKLANAEQLKNEVYQVKHSKLGKMDLLLSAVPDAQGTWGLEAILN
ncbi:MAG: DUF6916 family protein [Arenicella sp.]